MHLTATKSPPTRVPPDSVGCTCRWPIVGGDEVGDLRLHRSAKPANGILKDPICIGDAMMLPEMLKPRCNHEGFEEASAHGRILKNVPKIGAVLPALLTQISSDPWVATAWAARA